MTHIFLCIDPVKLLLGLTSSLSTHTDTGRYAPMMFPINSMQMTDYRARQQLGYFLTEIELLFHQQTFQIDTKFTWNLPMVISIKTKLVML